MGFLDNMDMPPLEPDALELHVRFESHGRDWVAHVDMSLSASSSAVELSGREVLLLCDGAPAGSATTDQWGVTSITTSPQPLPSPRTREVRFEARTGTGLSAAHTTPIPTLAAEQRADAEANRDNLAGRDLRGWDLRGANLAHANLERALLDNALLANTKLWKANLRGASLRDVDLTSADLEDAILEDADCERADFTHAKLHNTTWQGADLSDALGLPYPEPWFDEQSARISDAQRVAFEAARLEAAQRKAEEEERRQREEEEARRQRKEEERRQAEARRKAKDEERQRADEERREAEAEARRIFLHKKYGTPVAWSVHGAGIASIFIWIATRLFLAYMFIVFIFDEWERVTGFFASLGFLIGAVVFSAVFIACYFFLAYGNQVFGFKGIRDNNFLFSALVSECVLGALVYFGGGKSFADMAIRSGDIGILYQFFSGVYGWIALCVLIFVSGMYICSSYYLFKFHEFIEYRKL